MGKREKSNPLLDSVLELKKLEYESEMMLAYDALKIELGDQFEHHMEGVAEEILALQKEAVKGTTYFIAGLLLTIPPDDETANEMEMTKDDFKFYSRIVKAAIHWGKLKGYK